MAYFIFLGRLQFGQTSLVPPLPHILANKSTQELIMIHCLSNTIDPDASDVTCLSVYDWIYRLICMCTSNFKMSLCIVHFRAESIIVESSPNTHFPPFLLQVCVLCNGSNSSCSYPVHSYNKVAKEQRGQSNSRGLLFKRKSECLWDAEDQRLLQ